jgi:hypothetical protein
MAAPDNTDQSGGYRAGYSQPRQERITLPGIREVRRPSSAVCRTSHSLSH